MGGVVETELLEDSYHPLATKVAAEQFAKLINEDSLIRQMCNDIRALKATTSAIGMTQLTTAANITDASAYALSGVEKNASVSGSLAQKISTVDQSLTNWSKKITTNQSNITTNTNSINSLKTTANSHTTSINNHTSSLNSIGANYNIRHISISGAGNGTPSAVELIKSKFSTFPDAHVFTIDIWNGWVAAALGYRNGNYGFFVILSYGALCLTLLKNYGGSWTSKDI